MQLRYYQKQAIADIFNAWGGGAQNILYVLPTGGGKTVIFSAILKQVDAETCVIAHRRELLEQMAITLGRNEILHKIIGPDNVIRLIVKREIEELGRDFYSPSAKCTVASIDSLMSRKESLAAWAKRVKYWVLDEGHHLLEENKWGTGVSLFTNARGLAVTATPGRADGLGLGRHADGLIDVMLFGPDMRWLIDNGFLTDYYIACPPSTLDLSDVHTGKDGDFVRRQLSLKTQQSSVFGDVVQQYLKFTPGKLGVTFVPDIETASVQAEKFQAAGVPAEAVSSKTPSRLRAELLRRFRRRELLQLVNCDLFGEGFDLPAVEVISMARATQSWPLFAQQFGRVLRPMEGKECGWVLDHVGNVIRHNGPPDCPRAWSLDRRERRSVAVEVETIRICGNKACYRPFERFLTACPFCGWRPIPAERSEPRFVDGDLHELDPEVLAAMRGERDRIDRPMQDVRRGLEQSGKSFIVAQGAAKQHERRQHAQAGLRFAISWWSGFQGDRSQSEQYRRFYHKFGIDVMTAQTLGKADAESLRARIMETLKSEVG